MGPHGRGDVEALDAQGRRGQAEGLLDDEQGLLTGAIEFSDRTARQVMVPADALVAVDPTSTPSQVEALVARTGFSRFPVRDYGELVGYLHLKDVLYAEDADRDLPVPRWRVRALAVVRPDDEIEETLAAMQRTGTHLARVDDDSGACHDAARSRRAYGGGGVHS